MVWKGVVVATALSGCFVQLGGSYSPSTAVSVQRATDPMPIARTEASYAVNFRIGFTFDLFGFGANYAPYAAHAMRATSGLSHNFNGTGNYIRLDGDLPFLVFGPDYMLKLRASYAHERFDAVSGGPDGQPSTSSAAHGQANHAGLTLSSFNNDASLNVLVGKSTFQSQGGDPNVGLGGWDLDVGVTFRFIPTGFLISHYVAGPATHQSESSTTTHYSWGVLGMTHTTEYH